MSDHLSYCPDVLHFPFKVPQWFSGKGNPKTKSTNWFPSLPIISLIHSNFRLLSLKKDHQHHRCFERGELLLISIAWGDLALKEILIGRKNYPAHLPPASPAQLLTRLQLLHLSLSSKDYFHLSAKPRRARGCLRAPAAPCRLSPALSCSLLPLLCRDSLHGNHSPASSSHPQQQGQNKGYFTDSYSRECHLYKSKVSAGLILITSTASELLEFIKYLSSH